MQLLRLEFQGIGPFVGRHDIDFAALGAGGLFLLEGPTGAGKTTIIDAIVFALYGDVAGADSSKARLVSTQLPAGVEPYVDATIETGRGLYRVRRVPQHTRRKARGSGTTIGKAAIKLWRLSSPADPGTLLSTSLPEASEELLRIVGLSKEQFTQTVVLPQGHFATFLRAKPEDRRGVLQDIFGTEFYERCARRLSELAAGYRAADADARAALERAGSSFATVAWAPGEQAREDFAGALGSDEAIGLATARVAELDAAAALAADEARRVERAASGDEAALRSATERNGLLAEHAMLAARLTELSAAAPEIAAARARADAAERAEHARHPMDAVARARVGLDAAHAEASRGLASVADSPDADLIADPVDPGALESAATAAREGRSALTMLVETEGGLASRAEQLRLNLDELAKKRTDARRAAELVERDRASAADLAPEFEAVLDQAGTRAECIALEAAARGRVADVARLEAAASEFVQSRAVEKVAGEAAAVASDEHLVARTTWLTGLAGTLAGELTAGEPCPVCGSRKHPAPARRPDGAADRAEVERLDTAARLAEQEFAAARARSDSLATAMADHQAVVGDLTRIEAEVALAEASERKRMAERAVEQATTLKGRIEALLAGAESRERALVEAEKQLATEKGNLGARAERLEADRKRVAAELAGHGSVAERAAALGRRAERAGRLAVLVRQRAAAEAELVCREAELAAVLTEQGFADAAPARAALLAAVDRQGLRRRVGEHASALSTVTERLADERFAGVGSAGAAGDGAVDEGPLRLAAEASRAALQVALEASGAAASRAVLAVEAASELAACVGALEQIKEKAEPYLAMADLASGSGANLAAVTLPTFVLLRRFEEVVDLANVRLDAMTGGRYALRRTDAREGRAHKLGLGLEVVDHASGDATRDPKTLSGGETFQASLAMALGLADAVTSEAGGVELNTLFVDEGFGSLDSEALDMVMDQLTALREGGRCVGVVSHVAEMKQRIAERVTVLPRRDGTSTLTSSTDPQPALAG